MTSINAPADNDLLQKEISSLKAMLSRLQEELRIGDKRYQIAISGMSDIIYDYIVSSRRIVNSPEALMKYGPHDASNDSVEALIAMGMIHPNSAEGFRRLYSRIDAGAETSKEIIIIYDINGTETINEITLTNIFDDNGTPIHAIGLIHDVTKSFQLRKEMEYSDTLTSDKQFIYEANVSENKITRYDDHWKDEFKVNTCEPLSKIMEHICLNFVEPTHRKEFLRCSSPEFIIEAYEKGRRLVTFEFRKQMSSLGYQWYEKTLNIIKDDITGDINVRCYSTNISQRKEKELRKLSEQNHYASSLSESVVVYDFNITKDLILKGEDSISALCDSAHCNTFSYVIETLATTSLHPDDRKKFINFFSRTRILSAFRCGERELSCEYRRADESGKFIWISCTVHLFSDPNTDDIRAFTYVDNIDNKKKAQLELVYKSQHDLLTGCYNKITVAELMDAYFTTAEGHTGCHAFFIIDLDHFKDINDNFGHAFGDAILSQVSAKISGLFREDDIMGRIGGDEFVILMKNIQSDKAAILKAQEICNTVLESYTNGDTKLNISVSIGIAYYDKQNKSYDELYNHSDAALYRAKENGRNCYTVYSADMNTIITSVKEIDNTGLVENKRFEENITEFVFRILYESPDKRTAINSVLELVGKHYNVSRAYVFENSPDGLYTNNTFEWCGKGISPQIDNLQSIPYTDLGDYKSHFNEEGIFYMSSIDVVTDAAQEILKPQGIYSMVQFSIEKSHQFIGFIGFDQCVEKRSLSQNEMGDCRNAANILGVFITEMRAIEAAVLAKQTTLSIVNALHSYAYVCNPDTYEVLFINQSTQEIAPTARVGDSCYKAFWNRESPCEACPMYDPGRTYKSKPPIELYNTNLKIWVKSTSAWIDWQGTTKACLIDSVDITEFKTNSEVMPT